MSFFEKLNRKSKGEQMFIMLFMFVAVVGVMGLTGCLGEDSCEMPSCNNSKVSGVSMSSCSVPGCGGCLSSGSGCDSACWPQSCKTISVSADKDSQYFKKLELKGCDTRYYGGGCLGCAQTQKSCYVGCVDYDDGTLDFNGVFYGNSSSKEQYISCDGCGGCTTTNGELGTYMIIMEDVSRISSLPYFKWSDGNTENDNQTTEGDLTEDGESYEQEDEPSYEEWQVVEIEERQGRINTQGGKVSGYKSSYVVDGGKSAKVRKSLGDGWQVVTSKYCYSRNTLWYELYDTEDGDYYGWVDSQFIDFDD